MALRWVLIVVLAFFPLACQTTENNGKGGDSTAADSKSSAHPSPESTASNSTASKTGPGHDTRIRARELDPTELGRLSIVPNKFTFFPGDVIVVSIFEETEFRNVEIRISTELKIHFPYVGVIDLAGKGIIDLETELKGRLEEKMLTQAQVSVFLKTPAKRWIYTLGNLKYPHAFEIPPMGSLCVADAISLSRGYAEDGDRDRVEITRFSEGKLVEFILPRKYFKAFYLLPGDKIRVPEAQRVYVRGEVREPGAFLVPEFGLNVEEALTRAKVKEDADLACVVVQRRNIEGKLEVFHNVALNFALRPGDMVLAQGLRKVYVIGSVKKPGGYTIPAGGLRTTMAVALAEGWSRLASPNDTYVKRRMPDGSTKVFEVPLKDIMQGKVPHKNIELQPGDEVYIPESFF